MALVLERRKGERIHIGEDVVIEIAQIGRHGDRVWLAITAPKELAVHREEVYRKIKRTEAEQ